MRAGRPRSSLDLRAAAVTSFAATRSRASNAPQPPFQDDVRPVLSNDKLLLNEAIREYLEFSGYRHTLSVFLAGARSANRAPPPPTPFRLSRSATTHAPPPLTLRHLSRLRHHAACSGRTLAAPTPPQPPSTHFNRSHTPLTRVSRHCRVGPARGAPATRRGRGATPPPHPNAEDRGPHRWSTGHVRSGTSGPSPLSSLPTRSRRKAQIATVRGSAPPLSILICAQPPQYSVLIQLTSIRYPDQEVHS